MHLIVAFWIYQNNFIPRFTYKYFDTPAAYNANGKRMIVAQQANDSFVPSGAAVFLGDSITNGLLTSAVAPYSVNYGIGGSTTAELLKNIPKYQSLKRASAIFLMIGINDIGQNRPEGLAARLSTIVAALPNDVPLVWSGIMPAYSDKIDYAQIQSANRAIRELCSARDGCTYVDTQAIFSTGGARLFQDGVHPNNQGYEKWISALRKAYQDLSQQKSNNSFQPKPLRGAARLNSGVNCEVIWADAMPFALHPAPHPQ